jgi:hypothetical protein
MKAIGNRLANTYWEKNMPPDFKRPSEANRSLMSTFIRQKYVLKQWADFGPPPNAVFNHMNQTAVTAQKDHHKSRSRTPPKSKQAAAKPLQFSRPEPIESNVLKPEKISIQPGERLSDFFGNVPSVTVPEPVRPHKRQPVERDKTGLERYLEEIDDFFKGEEELLGQSMKKHEKSVAIVDLGPQSAITSFDSDDIPPKIVDSDADLQQIVSEKDQTAFEDHSTSVAENAAKNQIDEAEIDDFFADAERNMVPLVQPKPKSKPISMTVAAVRKKEEEATKGYHSHHSHRRSKEMDMEEIQVQVERNSVSSGMRTAGQGRLPARLQRKAEEEAIKRESEQRSRHRRSHV